jgi:RNA polymerase sigma factor (TIGR02999 family)
MDNASATHDVTELLSDVRRGDEEAADALFDRVYTELRQRARGQRKRWKGDPSLQTTALAHEAYLKLVGQEEQSWKNRSHFFAVSARAMRHILIDRARRKRRDKRGGEAPIRSLDELRDLLGRDVAMTEDDAAAFVLLDDALEQLEDEHPRAARGVVCRFFGGMTIEETAEALGVSTATVSRDWNLAKAWLYRAMKDRPEEEDASDSAT